MSSEPHPQWHTILSESIRPELMKKAAERRDIEEHVGHFIIAWGFVDFFLSMAVAAWTGPGRGQRLQRTMYQQGMVSKIDMLEAMLPNDWKDGRALIKYLREGNAYRNTIAHHALAEGGQDGDKSYGWHFWKITGTKHKHLEIDASSIADQNVKADVLREAVASIMRDEFLNPDADLSAASLAKAICDSPGQWDTRAEFDAFQLKARQMFRQ